MFILQKYIYELRLPYISWFKYRFSWLHIINIKTNQRAKHIVTRVELNSQLNRSHRHIQNEGSWKVSLNLSLFEQE